MTKETVLWNLTEALNLRESQVVGGHRPWRKPKESDFRRPLTRTAVAWSAFFFRRRSSSHCPAPPLEWTLWDWWSSPWAWAWSSGTWRSRGRSCRISLTAWTRPSWGWWPSSPGQLRLNSSGWCLSLPVISSWHAFPSPLRYTPVGILFLITGKILEMKDLAEMGNQLGMYTVSVIVGLVIHALVVLPLLFYVVIRYNPYRFIGGLLQALLTALGTSSRSSSSSGSQIFCHDDPKPLSSSRRLSPLQLCHPPHHLPLSGAEHRCE